MMHHDEILKSIISDTTETFNPIQIFKDCKNYGDHNFVPYKCGTVQCTKCGKFAKVGYMQIKE